MTLDEHAPTKRSLGILRIAPKTKARSPDLTGQFTLQRHTLGVICRQFEESDEDELVCCIAGWENHDSIGPYLTVEISPKYVKRESRPTKSNLSFLFKRQEDA